MEQSLNSEIVKFGNKLNTNILIITPIVLPQLLLMV